MVRARGLFIWSAGILVLLIVLSGSLPLGQGGGSYRVQAASCWQAKITEQQTNVDLPGSILRVSVQGKAGLPVTIRAEGGFEAVGYTGTKPEYGPYAVEFAALSKATYSIEPQGLGLVFKVWLDGKSYTRVDFTPVSCAPTSTPTRRPATTTPRPSSAATHQPAATQGPAPALTPTRVPTAVWKGRVGQHLTDLEGRSFATIAVRVIGRPAGQEVKIQSGGWSATCKTGTKPEYGPDACEFGALNAGAYRLTPTGLGTQLDVAVEQHDFSLIEFYYTGPVPKTRWVGSLVANTSGSTPTKYANSAIAVIVSGKPWHLVEIRTEGWGATCNTGTKPEYGPDACEFGGLRSATYTITPKDLGVSFRVTVDGKGWAKVRFDQVPVPTQAPAGSPSKPKATPTPPRRTPTPVTGPTSAPQPSPTKAGSAWLGRVVSNTSGERQGTGVASVIVVRVLGRPGVTVEISSEGSWSAMCLTGTKPEYGPDACEFGGLWPGKYSLRPAGADIQVQVAMDGLGTAFVEFTPPSR
jgi:hypothetical protein